MSSKIWVGLNKEAPLLPKSDGEGYMLSAMQLSWTHNSGRQACLINEQCQGKNYVDMVAVMEVLGCIEKNTRRITIHMNDCHRHQQ